MLSFLCLLYFISSGECSVYYSSVYGISRDRVSLHRRSTGLAVRQTNDPTSNQCFQVLYETQCSSTKYAQNFINSLSQCGSAGQTLATEAEAACRQNSEGEYCGSAEVDSSSILNAQNLCSNCSSACRNILEDLINRHGCCLTSNSGINLISSAFHTCGMTLPPACPMSSLNVPSNPNRDTTCTTSNEFLERIYAFPCTRQNIEPIKSALRSTSGCESLTTLIEVGCGYRNGMYCFKSLINPSSSYTTALATATTSCISTSSCSDSCRNSLNEISNTLGCCFSLYNASLQVAEGISSASNNSTFDIISSNDLWDECNLTPPGLCPVRLSGANGFTSVALFQVFTTILIVITSFV